MGPDFLSLRHVIFFTLHREIVWDTSQVAGLEHRSSLNSVYLWPSGVQLPMVTPTLTFRSGGFRLKRVELKWSLVATSLKEFLSLATASKQETKGTRATSLSYNTKWSCQKWSSTSRLKKEELGQLWLVEKQGSSVLNFGPDKIRLKNVFVMAQAFPLEMHFNSQTTEPRTTT